MSEGSGWTYERVGASGEADGRTCIECGERIARESSPGYWVRKAEEDKQDADYVTETGYTHYECTQKRLAAGRRRSFTLPDVPDLPRG